MLLLALRGTEELFHERTVEVRPHLDDPVFGYTDDPAIVVVVGPVGDAGGPTVLLREGQLALGDDSPHAGPNRLLERTAATRS